MKNKDKDKEKDKEKGRGKEKSKVDLDTEMDGGYSKVRVHRAETMQAREKHTLRSPLQMHRPCNASVMTWGHPGVIELSVFVTENGCVLHFLSSSED